MRGITSLKQQFLNSNMYFSLIFAEGLVFGRILYRELFNYKPLSLQDDTGTAINLAAAAVSSETFIVDSRNSGNQVLGGDKMNPLYGGHPHVYHANFGIFPNHMQAYVKYPGKTAALVNPPMNGLPVPQPANVDHLSKMDGDDSPYEDPTNFNELLIVPNQSPSVQFVNDMPAGADFNADSERVVINVMAAHYVFDILRPVMNAREINLTGAQRQRAKADNRLIRKMMMGDLDPIFRFFKVGAGENSISFDSQLQQMWNVRPIMMEDAKGLEEP